MRYQYPAPNPIGHYWEEESIGVWGLSIGIPRKAGFYLNYFLGEIIFANLYLIFQFILSQSTVVGLRNFTARIAGDIKLGPAAKRAIDMGGAVVGLLISFPFWLIIAIAIKIDSKGPILYKQERVGRNRRRQERRAVLLPGQERRSGPERRNQAGHGRKFWILKFRSMYIDAESATGPVWAQKNDPRITRVGRILRMLRLDELPQFWNVLVGDMSIVGPRPERPYFVNEFGTRIENYTSRFIVKPGITGLAQVEHKYDESLEDVSKKVIYDLRYIRNWTIFQDFKIIFKTVVVVLTARGM